MYLTEQEILDTPIALLRTCQYFETRRQRLKEFFKEHNKRKFVFLGCGSSYMLSKSAATFFASLPDTTASAIPAGDYIVAPDSWSEVVKDSIVVTLSRSGRTTEMVRAVTDIKEKYGNPVVSISMENNNDIMPMSSIDLIMDWCYDRSVCQTRTVANLYAATLLLASAYAGDDSIAKAVEAISGGSADFQAVNRPTLEKIAAMDWDNAVVLADGAVCGIAEEGALAFTEIAMLAGRYFHLLDYRHGPIVISGAQTLTLILLRPDEEALQGAMVQDVIKHGGTVVTVSEQEGNPYSAAAHITIKDTKQFAAWGIPLIYLAQMLAFQKAMVLGGNPDAPKGLDAYIKL